LPIELPPSHVDITTSRSIQRHATPFMERAGKVVTFAADEKEALASVGLKEGHPARIRGKINR